MGVSTFNLPVPTGLGGVYELVGSIQLTSFTWWGFQYLQNCSKDRLRILPIVLEEELKSLTLFNG